MPQQKQAQITKSLDKFKKHFHKNLETLHRREVHKRVAPKYSVCFVDLAGYLGMSLAPFVQDGGGKAVVIRHGDEFDPDAPETI